MQYIVGLFNRFITEGSGRLADTTGSYSVVSGFKSRLETGYPSEYFRSCPQSPQTN
jgi:hypothetical protein